MSSCNCNIDGYSGVAESTVPTEDHAGLILIHGSFPKLWILFWGVPIIRTILFWGLSGGPLFRETTIYLLGRVRVLGLRASGFWRWLRFFRGLEFRVQGRCVKHLNCRPSRT